MAVKGGTATWEVSSKVEIKVRLVFVNMGEEEESRSSVRIYNVG